MSYDVHIIKSEHWFMSNERPITEIEFTQVIKHLKDLPVFYQDGRLTLCGANKPAIEVLIAAANKIGAKVQGDEGEYYD
ncbi:hypothetical protein [Paenibacillus kobensis]|uniref:hypothetical protein n=1 Tax=Paenibacillus kobensis TaxID=59841 RepID=UPI000FD7E39E|nr:hypothetical protein [Paenibacillus kobensis]